MRYVGGNQRAALWGALVCLLLLGGCVGPEGALLPGDSPSPTSSPSPTATPDPCPRDPAPANRSRVVVVGHPYDAGAGQADVYAVWTLSENGDLVPGNTTFEMGRAIDGEIVFTPDGEIGLVAQEDGSVGVFRALPGGDIDVIDAHFTGSFYADSVWVTPDGKWALVNDPNWRENGGGIYGLEIGCDGRLIDRGLIAAAKSPGGFAPVPATDRLLVAATDLLDSSGGPTVHLLADWLDDPQVVGAADAYGDNEAIVSSVAVTTDGHYGLVADNNAFSGIPNRIAVVEIDGEHLIRSQVLSPIEDPVDLVTSPFGNAALVVSAFGDALYHLDYAPGVVPAFSNTGELSYTGGGPQLPATAALIERGDLTGLVLVGENVGVRLVRFDPGGTITDLGLVSAGTGYEAIVGAVGVQP